MHMHPREERNYKVILRDCLARRCNANQRYSLRAFARDIGISPGQLSSILAGRRGLSRKSADRMFESLGLREHEKEICLLQIQRDFARSKKARMEAQQLLKDRLSDLRAKELSADAFDVIADWFHFAILQVLCLKNAEHNEKRTSPWIAKQLDLSEIEVKSALERLIRLKLVKISKGNFVITDETILSTDGIPSSALRKFHRQVLEKAMQAIELQTVKERYLNTIMLPVALNQIESVQKDIFQFQRQMMKKYGRNSSRDGDAVYSLSQQFFRLSGGQI